MIFYFLQPLLPATTHLLYALCSSPLLSQTRCHSFLFSTTSISITTTLSLSLISSLSAVSSMKTLSEHTSAFSLTLPSSLISSSLLQSLRFLTLPNYHYHVQDFCVTHMRPYQSDLVKVSIFSIQRCFSF
ncbi:uncharacterized protein DS421_12g357590 [Arachis hypogaea]|nr:uncharacterized protein DS421_12g357590 [Arachis hypogaea]